MKFNVWSIPRTGITVLNDTEVIIASRNFDDDKGHSIILNTVSTIMTMLTKSLLIR